MSALLPMPASPPPLPGQPFGDWRSGGEPDPGAGGAAGLSASSYRVLDLMITAALEDPAGTYPALKRVVVLGHSAGGQLVHRYALARRQVRPPLPPSPADPSTTSR